MLEKKGGATAGNGGPARVCSIPTNDSADHSRNGENFNGKAAAAALTDSGVKVLRDREFAHYIDGNPHVVIERRKGSAWVFMRPVPWGWSNPARQFLNPDSPGVDRYAQKLLGLITEAGKKEAARRDRLRAARLREREALSEARKGGRVRV